MEELIQEKNVLCEGIKKMINEFLEKNHLEFSSLSYDTDWSGDTPKIEKIKLRITI